MGQVQDPDRDEIDAGPYPVLVGHVQLHPGLLQLDLTGGALDLDLVGLQDPIAVLILGLDLGRLQEGVLELDLPSRSGCGR